MKHFTHEQLQAARKADLYKYVMANHAIDFREEGRSIRMAKNHSLSIRMGQSGYKDFATDDSGNSVDFLIKYMGYQLDDAVFALCGDVQGRPAQSHKNQAQSLAMQENLPPTFPSPASSYRQVFGYLMGRGISAGTIQMLIDSKLLYQSADHNNCVFINKERDWAEIRGTYTYGKPFHGIIPNARKDGFWWFRTDTSAEVCYVCEASIDAISLYELHKRQGTNEKAFYIGIGGVAKQEAIDRIKNHFKTVIAVDNDEAGDACRKRNPDCDNIRPQYKDWNEDLQSMCQKKSIS